MREIKFKYEPITKYKDLYSTRYRFRFENGYGASVVRRIGTYGGEEGLWELAVLIFDGNNDASLTYDTPVTDDVIGYLSVEDVNKILDQIKELK